MSDTIIITQTTNELLIEETIPTITITTGVRTIGTGPTGATGPQGDPGADATNPIFTVSTGAPGSSVVLTGTYPNLNLQIPEGDPGNDGREVEFQSNGTYIQWRYVGEATWTDLVLLSTLKGDTGATGPQGIQGDPGADAQDPNFTVSTGSAGSSVVLSGTYPNQNIQIPRGDAGTNGSNGVGVPVGGTANQVLSKIDGTDYNTKWITPSAGIISGISEIDFGSTPSSETTLAVTGQADILSTSTVHLTINARTTTDNTANDHEFAAIAIRLSATDITAGVGFTIKAYCLIGFVTGKFKVNWSYS